MTTPSSPLTPASLALLDHYSPENAVRPVTLTDREWLAARLVEVEEQAREVALDIAERRERRLQAADAQLVRLRQIVVAFRTWWRVGHDPIGTVQDGTCEMKGCMGEHPHPREFDIEAALNSTAEDNKEALARIREEAVAPFREALSDLALDHGYLFSPDGVKAATSCVCPAHTKTAALLTENKPKSEAGEVA